LGDRIELIKCVDYSIGILVLNLNVQKTTVMSTGKINIFSDDEDISKVTNCKFLVVLITDDSYNEETKKSLSFNKQGMANLTKVGKFWNLYPT